MHTYIHLNLIYLFYTDIKFRKKNIINFLYCCKKIYLYYNTHSIIFKQLKNEKKKTQYNQTHYTVNIIYLIF